MLDLLRELPETISESFLLKLAGGIGGAALLWAAKRLWDAIVSPFFNKPFSLAGTWIGLCEMDDYTAVEIYRVAVRAEHAAFSFFSFRCDSMAAQRFVGSGISRGNFLSAFYYSPKAANQVSGVFSLQTGFAGDELRGAFTQYTKTDNNSVRSLPKRKEFELTRVPIPFLRQLRMIFRQPPFQTYNEAFQFYEAATTPQQRAAA